MGIFLTTTESKQQRQRYEYLACPTTPLQSCHPLIHLTNMYRKEHISGVFCEDNVKLNYTVVLKSKIKKSSLGETLNLSRVQIIAPKIPIFFLFFQCIMCHLSCVMCHMSHSTCHLSLMPTGTATDPPPANSPLCTVGYCC